MPGSREQFDQDLDAYVTAVDAFIALPQIVDLAAEDDKVKAALDRIPKAPQPGG